MARAHGARPVTLCGYGLGARVIFYCLLELSSRSESQGIVQNAYMFGTAVNADALLWGKAQSVVSGRIVNGYCRDDWLLKFVFRTANASLSIAGLGPIEFPSCRIENIDVSTIINGHLQYQEKLPELLQLVGIASSKPDVPTPVSTLHPA